MEMRILCPEYREQDNRTAVKQRLHLDSTWGFPSYGYHKRHNVNVCNWSLTPHLK